MKQQNKDGFTLIEVLIAMIIVALSVLGALKLSGGTTRGIAQIRDKTTADYISMNVLTQQLLGERGFYLKTGGSSGKSLQSGQDWPWQVQVKSQSESLLNININVYLPGDNKLAQEITLQIYNNAS